MSDQIVCEQIFYFTESMQIHDFSFLTSNEQRIQKFKSHVFKIWKKKKKLIQNKNWVEPTESKEFGK